MTKFPSNAKPSKFDIIQCIVIYKKEFTCKVFGIQPDNNLQLHHLYETYEQNVTKFPSNTKPRKFDIIQSIVIYKEGFTCKVLEHNLTRPTYECCTYNYFTLVFFINHQRDI